MIDKSLNRAGYEELECCGSCEFYPAGLPCAPCLSKDMERSTYGNPPNVSIIGKCSLWAPREKFKFSKKLGENKT